jgi:hypothetical protein
MNEIPNYKESFMSMDKNTNLSQAEERTPTVSEESRLEARRDFLKKAGKFALYTPPVVTLLMYPSMQAIAKSSGGGGGGGAIGRRGRGSGRRGRGFGRRIAAFKGRGPRR